MSNLPAIVPTPNTPANESAVYKSQIAAIANTATATFKRGKDVFLFAADFIGSYTDAAAAIADVDSGGTLWLMDEYDVPTHGAIEITKAINIRGSGYAAESYSGPADHNGSVIRNDAGALPNCIVIDAGTTEKTFRTAIKDIAISHKGSDYAVDVYRSRWCTWNNFVILCSDTGIGGIKFSGQPLPGTDPANGSWYQVLDGIHINNFTERGVWFNENIGSKNKIINSTIESLVDNVAHVAAVEITAGKDIYIADSQINLGDTETPSLPGILVNASSVNDCYGIVIERCLTEYGGPLVRFTSSDGGTHKCYDSVVRDCSTWLFTDKPNMEFVEFDYAERCLFETPLQYVGENQYGGVSGSGILCTFTANSKDNLAILHSNWAEAVYVDNGLRNVVKCLHMPDAQYINALHQWPTGSQQTDFIDSASASLYRNPLTTIGDQTAKVWNPQNGTWAAETLLTGSKCVLWLDAADTSTLWQDIAGSVTQADTDGDTVLYWDDKSGNGNDFDTRVGGSTGYSHTTVDEATTTFTSTGIAKSPLKVTGTITIDGVTGADAGSINGDWTATYVDINNFTIAINSSALTYDSTVGIVRVHDNTPLLETDCFSRGVSGIKFDGVDDVFEQVTKLTTIDLDEVNDIGTMVIVYSPVKTAVGFEMMIGRNSGERISTNQSGSTMIIGVEWGDVATSYNVTLDANTSTLVTIATREDTGADWSDIIYTAMSDDVSTDAGQTASFVGALYPWQVGSSGVTRDMYSGYVHAAVLFNTTLTEAEARQIMFYFSNKFMATPGA